VDLANNRCSCKEYRSDRPLTRNPLPIGMTHSGNDRLLMGSPLRRRGVSKAITAVLLVILVFATLVQLVVFTCMPPGRAPTGLR